MDMQALSLPVKEVTHEKFLEQDNSVKLDIPEELQNFMDKEPKTKEEAQGAVRSELEKLLDSCRSGGFDHLIKYPRYKDTFLAKLNEEDTKLLKKFYSAAFDMGMLTCNEMREKFEQFEKAQSFIEMMMKQKKDDV